MQESLNLTPKDLQAMIAAAVTAAIQESRKPAPPTDQEVAQLKMKQEHRLRTANEVIRTEENKRANQRICSHEHNNGDTHCVWVREENPASPGFILCQRQQCRIRPGDLTKDYEQPAFLRDRGAIYDTNLFNKLFQKCAMHADMN
jgi:hypothetical protein